MNIVSIPKSEELDNREKQLAPLGKKLRIFFQLSKYFLSSIQSRKTDYVSLLGIFLRLPQASVKEILGKNQSYVKKLDARRYRTQKSSFIGKYCKEFQCAREADYCDLVQRDQRSRILCSFHMGDYIYGCNYLASLEEGHRSKKVLSFGAAPESYFDNLTKAFGNSSIKRSAELLVEQTSVVDLTRLIRSEKTTLLMFCDLPAEYGETVTVPFLGRRARFSKGPAVVALASRTPLLPVVNFIDGQINCIEIRPLIEPNIKPGENFTQAVVRITAELVSTFEEIFKSYPEQWRYLTLLPDYFEAMTPEK